MSRITHVRARLLGCLALVAALTALIFAPAAGASTPKTYLALGDSLAFGYTQAKFNAGLPSPNPASFHTGYVDDFFAALRLTGQANTLVNDGCPGKTTTSYLNGPCGYQAVGFGLHHPYAGGQFSSQKSDALAYLAAHPGEVKVVTVDLGANDALNTINTVCNRDPACIASHAPALFATIAGNLGTIIGQVRATAPAAKVIALGLYNPFGTALAGADALTAQLNTVLKGVATATGARFANPFPLFNPGGTLEAATICAFTNMCTPLVDIHPTDLGYGVLAGVVGAAYLGLCPSGAHAVPYAEGTAPDTEGTARMSLTVGTAPFGQRPAGAFNFEVPREKGVIYFEDSPRRIRAVFNGETVVDSRHAKLLHEQGHLPIYYFPADEVRLDLLESTSHATTCPFKGEASYWSVRVGDRVAENAVWSYPDPLDDAPPLAGYYALYWNRMDEWFEEDEPAIVHARDPYHRIDVLETSRHVTVSLAGEVLADSRRTLVLYETGLPPRWYFPIEDVRAELLTDSDARTGCAYKGFAAYWSVRVPGAEDEDDLVWTYRDPSREVAPIRDRLAFFDERVDIEVDGEAQERPITPWSRDHVGHGARRV